MDSMRRVCCALLVSIVLTPAIAGCTSSDGGGSTTQTTVDAAALRATADAICVRVSAEIDALTASAAATPAEAARSLRAVADASRRGVDELRGIPAPADLEDAFTAWLDTVDATANKLEAGALALQVRDDAAFRDAVADAETTGQQAADAARGLGLSSCAF